MVSRPPHQHRPFMRADPASATHKLLFLPQYVTLAYVDAELHTLAEHYLETAKLARARAKRYRSRGDMAGWRKACAVARVWEMAHEHLEMLACPF